jgi:hypothetical protein
VLGLVDDDDDVPPRQVLLQEKGPELVEQLDLLRAVVGEAELREQRLQQPRARSAAFSTVVLPVPISPVITTKLS